MFASSALLFACHSRWILIAHTQLFLWPLLRYGEQRVFSNRDITLSHLYPAQCSKGRSFATRAIGLIGPIALHTSSTHPKHLLALRRGRSFFLSGQRDVRRGQLMAQSPR